MVDEGGQLLRPAIRGRAKIIDPEIAGGDVVADPGAIARDLVVAGNRGEVKMPIEGRGRAGAVDHMSGARLVGITGGERVCCAPGRIGEGIDKDPVTLQLGEVLDPGEAIPLE